MQISCMEKLIGNTPMIKIECLHKNVRKCVFVKLEWYNLTGSIKDRPALYMIKKAISLGKLKENQPIVEATSGNMGISVSAIGTALGHPVHIFMPNWMSDERKKILKNYGAILHEVSREEGGFRGAIKLANELAVEIQAFSTNQFSNNDNVLAHYEQTANEILTDMGDTSIDTFISGIGTGGTFTGVSKRLKEINPNLKSCIFEPDTLSVLGLGHSCGEHKIAGVGDDFIPQIVDRKLIDKIFLIKDDDALNMARILARQLGLGVGISGGANFLTSVLANDTGDKNVVTVFADDNKKYLFGELSDDIDLDENFVSNEIKCVGFEKIN